jgi:hypothetical protein
MQIIGLALVSALIISAVAVASASAAHEWLINGAAITSAKLVHSKALVLLEDSKAIGGAVQVHCKGFNEGTVGPGALDLVKSVTAELLGTNDKIPCEFDPGKKGLCGATPTPTALAIHLPWHTLIVLIGPVVRDLILADGNGAPGWSVTCSAATDTCEEEAGAMGTTALTNVSGGVLATFDSETLPAKCSLGGAKSGQVRGTNLTENPSATEILTFM